MNYGEKFPLPTITAVTKKLPINPLTKMLQLTKPVTMCHLMEDKPAFNWSSHTILELAGQEVH